MKKFKLNRFLQILIYIGSAMLIAMFVYTAASFDYSAAASGGGIVEREAVEYNGWLAKGQDGKWSSVESLPVTLYTSDGTAAIRNTIPHFADEGVALFFRAKSKCVEVYIDGKLRLSNEVSFSNAFAHFFGTDHIFINLNDGDCGKPIEIHFKQVLNKNTLAVPEISFCSKSAMQLKLILDDAPQAICTYIELSFSFILILVATIVYRRHSKEIAAGLGELSFFAFITSCWMSCDRYVMEAAIMNVTLLTQVLFFAFMALPIPFMRFVRRMIPRRAKIIDGICTVYLINLFVNFALYITSTISPASLLPITQALVFLGFFAVYIFALIEFFKYKSKQLIEMVLGLSIMFVVAVISILFYYGDDSHDISGFFRLGLVCLSISLSCGAIRRMVIILLQSRFFEHIASAAPCGMLRISCAGDHEISYANEFMRDMLGMTEAELSGLAMSNLVYPPDRHAFETRLFECTGARDADGVSEDFDAEYRIVAGDRPPIWVLSRFHMDGADYIATTIDITARKAAEDKLMLSEEEYRIAVSQSDKLVARFDIAEKSLHIVTGGYSDKLYNMPDSFIEEELVEADSVQTVRKFFQAICDGRDTGSMIFRAHGDGEDDQRWVRANFTAVRDTYGKSVHAIITMEDVSLLYEKELAHEKWKLSFKSRDAMLVYCAEYSLETGRFIRDDGQLFHAKDRISTSDFTESMAQIAHRFVIEDDAEAFTAFASKERLLHEYARDKFVDRMIVRRRDPVDPEQFLYTDVSVDMYLDPYSLNIVCSIMFEDSDKKRRAELDLEQRTEKDALTGLYNRYGFMKKFNEILETVENGHHTLVMIDLNNFKMINDKLGHAMGDQVLCDVADTLIKLFRGNDVCSRLGGDEFLVCMKGAPPSEALSARIKYFCGELEREYDGVKVSGSFGVSHFPEDGEAFDVLFKKADERMYKAKQEFHAKEGTPMR